MDAESRVPEIPGIPEERCAECGTRLIEGQDRQETDDAVFCRSCFEHLSREVERAMAKQGEDIDYSSAAVGGVLGAALGVGVWWGFTVVTKVSLGLIAIVIGIATGKGVVMMSGHKRHRNLQLLSVGISVLGFVYATYLVNRTFIQRVISEEGRDVVLPWLPDLELLLQVLTAGFGIMDLVFLAIVIFEAWRIPAPVRMAPRP